MTFTFLMTVINTDGTTAEGACADADVRRALATAARRGYQVVVTAQGGAEITREIPGNGRHTVVYRPFRSAGHLTPTMREDLRLIGIKPTAQLDPATGRIKAGHFSSIPPAASSRLRFHGLVNVDGTTVTIAMSARLAMLQRGYSPVLPWGYMIPAEVLAGFLGSLTKAV